MARNSKAVATKPPGRPTKYDAEVVKNIVDAIGAGLSIEDMCIYADIGKATFYDWLNIYPEFSDAVRKAEVKGKMRRILRIEKAARDGAWQADAWYLERKYPEEFGRKLTLQVSPEDAALLKRLGLTLEQAWKILIQELAQDMFVDISAESIDSK